MVESKKLEKVATVSNGHSVEDALKAEGLVNGSDAASAKEGSK